jgi:hypothetical protein
LSFTTGTPGANAQLNTSSTSERSASIKLTRYRRGCGSWSCRSQNLVRTPKARLVAHDLHVARNSILPPRSLRG